MDSLSFGCEAQTEELLLFSDIGINHNPSAAAGFINSQPSSTAHSPAFSLQASSDGSDDGIEWSPGDSTSRTFGESSRLQYYDCLDEDNGESSDDDCIFTPPSSSEDEDENEVPARPVPDDYNVVFGRRFSKFGGWCSIDDELQIIDRIHINDLNRDRELFDIPLEAPKRVLDANPGTGILAKSRLIRFIWPECEVQALSNAHLWFEFSDSCHFDVADVHVWREPHSFDLISVSGLLGVRKFPELLGNMFVSLRDGGYLYARDRVLEFTDPSGEIGTLPRSNPWSKASLEIALHSSNTGGSFGVDNGAYDKLLTDLGFREVTERWETIPVTACLDIVLDQLECALTAKWDHEDVEEDVAVARLQTLRKALVSQADGVHVRCVTAWGLRPTVIEPEPDELELLGRTEAMRRAERRYLEKAFDEVDTRAVHYRRTVPEYLRFIVEMAILRSEIKRNAMPTCSGSRSSFLGIDQALLDVLNQEPEEILEDLYSEDF